MLLNGLNDVALALKLEELLCHHDVGVIDGAEEVTKVTLVLVKIGWVAEGTLVVRNGPGWGGHDAQVAVSGRVDRIHERHLRECSSLNCKQERSERVIRR